MSRMPSRFGRRALVTRPRAEAAALAEALAMRGIEAIIEPLLDIHYRDGHTPDLAGVQAGLCTNANGIRALARLSGERRIAGFALGAATAGRARARVGLPTIAPAAAGRWPKNGMGRFCWRR